MTVAPDDIVIFLGPTLSKEEAGAMLKARYLPPVKQGDLISIASQFGLKSLESSTVCSTKAFRFGIKKFSMRCIKGFIFLGRPAWGR
jgi:hypothetical protein